MAPSPIKTPVTPNYLPGRQITWAHLRNDPNYMKTTTYKGGDDQEQKVLIQEAEKNRQTDRHSIPISSRKHKDATQR